jgi:hypothetical protein
MVVTGVTTDVGVVVVVLVELLVHTPALSLPPQATKPAAATDVMKSRRNVRMVILKQQKARIG